MPKFHCFCKYVITVSRKDEIVECPVCGRRYRKPTFAEKHPKIASLNKSASRASAKN